MAERARRYIEIVVDAEQAMRKLGGIERATKSTEKHMSALQKQARALGNQFRYMIAGFGVQQFVQVADAARDLTARLSAAAGGAVEGARAFQDLREMGNRLGVDISELGSSYTKLAVAVPTAEHEDLTLALDTMATTLATTGASAQQVNAVMLQMAQALGSGALQGDEFRAVFENAPVLLRAWREAMEETDVPFRELSSNAMLTTESFFELLPQIKELTVQMIGLEEPPMTVGRAFQVVKNELIAALVEFEKASGVFELLGQVIILVGKALGVLLGAISAILGPIKDFVSVLGESFEGYKRLSEVQEEFVETTDMTTEAVKASEGTVAGLQTKLTDLTGATEKTALAQASLALKINLTTQAMLEQQAVDLRGMVQDLSQQQTQLVSWMAHVRAAGEDTASYANALGTVSVELAKNKDTLAVVEEQSKLFGATVNKSLDNLKKVSTETLKTTDATEKLSKAVRRTSKSVSEAVAVQDDYVDAVKALVDRLNPLDAMTEQYAEEVRLLVRSYQESGGLIESQEQLLELLGKLGTEYENTAVGLSKAEDKTDEFAESIKGLVEGGLADAFYNMFTGTMNGWKDMLKSMLNDFMRFVARVASQRIVASIPVLGTTGTAAAGTGGSGGGGLFGSLFGGGGGGAAGGVSSMFGTSAGYSGLFSGGGTASLGALGGGMLAGYGIGSMVGGAVSTKNNGYEKYGAAIGTAIGAIWGPIGAVVGGALGGLVGGLVGPDNSPRAQFIATKSENAQGFSGGVSAASNEFGIRFGLGGKTRGYEASEYAGVFESFAQTADILASVFGEGLTKSIRDTISDTTNQGKLRGLAIDTDDPQEAFAHIFGFIVTEAEKSGDMIGRIMAESFREAEGDAEAFIKDMDRAVTALGVIRAFAQEQITTVADYREALEASSKTIWESGQAANEVIYNIFANIEEFGLSSIDELEELSVAIQHRYQLEMRMLEFISQAIVGISDTAASLREQVQMDLMSETERQNYYVEQANKFAALMEQSTDPQLIAQYSEQALRYAGLAWGGLNEEQRLAQQGDYLAFINHIETVSTDMMLAAAEAAANNLEELQAQTRELLSIERLQVENNEISRSIADELKAIRELLTDQRYAA